MRLALFDFDGTLTTRDTLFPFLRFAVGNAAFVTKLPLIAPLLALYAMGLYRNDLAKEAVLTRYLEGRPRETLQRVGEDFATQRVPHMLKTSMMAQLEQHLNAGDQCVVVSASLDLYLQPWARARGFADAICSSLAFDEAGRATGRLAGANCYGPEKARRTQAWIEARSGAFERVVAYGDSRGDRELLALADEAIWV